MLSDTTWQCAAGPLIFDGLRNGEIYDARAEMPGWHEVEYDATEWRPTRIARSPGGVLQAQIMPPCRVTRIIPPVSVVEAKPGVWVFDLGCNITGWARLTVSGPAGASVVMRYAEKVGSDGSIDQSNINYLEDKQSFQKDTYIMKGVGIETYAARFAYYGFQYVEVTGLPAPPTLETIAGCEVHTDLEQIGAFHCSNQLLNSIQAAAVASTVGNYHGMPTDCPHREKNGWTGDAHLSAEQVLYNFAAESSYTKWLDDFADCQRPNGALPGIVPTGGWGFNWGSGPAWDSAYILIPWYMYLYKGDIGILRRHYRGMKKYMGFLQTLATDYIVKFGLGDWCPPAAVAHAYKAPAELTTTAYYYCDASLMARIATLLGFKGDQVRYATLAKRIREAARRHFFDKGSGRVAGHGQTAIACFLYHGLVDETEMAGFQQMLLAEIAACHDHIDCGILGAKYLLQVLSDLGCADVAYRIVGQQDYPGWGFWIKQGATSLWETWDGRASHNHHMFSDVSAWFYKTLAGIVPDPEYPGFKHTYITPWPVGDLSFVNGETHTPYGRLSVAWHWENDEFALDVEIPPNSTATVSMPVDNGGVSRPQYAIGSGKYSFRTRLTRRPC